MTQLYVQIIQWGVGIFMAGLFLKLGYDELFGKKEERKEIGLEDLED